VRDQAPWVLKSSCHATRDVARLTLNNDMRSDTASLIGRMIVPAAVLAGLGLLRRFLPPRKVDPGESRASNQANDDFRGTQWVVGSSMVLVALTFALLTHSALVMANRYFAEADGPAAFRLLPSPVIWWFFPGFGAICLTWPITLLIWSLFAAHDKIVRYSEWSDQRAGFDTMRAMYWMALLTAMPIGVATLLAIPIHSSLRDHDIAVGHYARFSSQHLPYSSARRLALVNGLRDRDGKFTPRADLIVDFANGTRWSSSDNRDFKLEVDPGLAEFIEQKTGLNPEQAETEADLAKLP
jgi:hypothetical protein